MDYREYYESKSRERKKKKRIKMRPRFFVFVVILIAVIILPFIIFSRPKGYTVVYGAYDTVGEGYSALVIRDDISFYSQTPGEVSYKVLEGDDVRAGDAVLDLYASDYISQLIVELQAVRESIKQYQEDSLLSKIVDSQLDSINSLIDEQVALISAFSQGDTSNMAKTELRLKELLAQRQNYIKSTSVAQADSAITELYANETQLLGKIDAWRTAYLAPQDGRVSVYFDGLESVLTPDILGTITVEQANLLIRGVKPSNIPPEITAQQALYRLTNPYRWYIVFTAPASDWQMAAGQDVLINIEGYSGLSATARVVRATVEEASKSTLVVLEINKDIGSVIGTRLANITIGSNVEGLMVPRKAVKTLNGQSGVYLMDGSFIPVEILTSDSSYSLVLPALEGALDKGFVIKEK